MIKNKIYFFIIFIVATFIYINRDYTDYLRFRNDYEKIKIFTLENIDFLIRNNSLDTLYNSGFYGYSLDEIQNRKALSTLNGGQEILETLLQYHTSTIYINPNKEFLFDIKTTMGFWGIHKCYIGYLPFSGHNPIFIYRKKLERKCEVQKNWFSFSYFDSFAD